jgi:glutathione S-transferase/GST-like protein
VRQRDPQELAAAIERIPLEARRRAWRKAIFNEFSAAELTESRRRVAFATEVLERHLTEHPWIAGRTFSLGDINAFNVSYALPFSQPERCNDAQTPRIMEWLRKIYERPATRRTWAQGRTSMAARVAALERKH